MNPEKLTNSSVSRGKGFAKMIALDFETRTDGFFDESEILRQFCYTKTLWN